MADAYSRGTEIELKGEFFDAPTDGVPVDPDEVTLEVRDPDGTTTTYTWVEGAEITRESEGVFTRTKLLDQSGNLYYRFTGTGVVNVSDWKLVPVIDDPLD